MPISPTAPKTIQVNGKTYELQLIDDQEIKSHKFSISNTVTITYIYKEVTEGTAEKPVTPTTPVIPTNNKKFRLPKGNNGVKTRIPVNYKHQTNSSNQGTAKLRLPKGIMVSKHVYHLKEHSYPCSRLPISNK